MRYQNQIRLHLPSRGCVTMGVHLTSLGFSFLTYQMGKGKVLLLKSLALTMDASRSVILITALLTCLGRAEPSDHVDSVCLRFCHTSSEPILRTLPSSAWGNVAMPTRWLLLITIYECAVQPSDKQFSSSLAWIPLPNCHKTDHLVHNSTQ